MMVKKSFPLSRVYQLLEPGPVVMVSTCRDGKPNIMTMSWHMMIDFMSPLVGCVISEENYSFKIVKQTGECVINIPTVELIQTVVDVGNTTGSKIDKFATFHLTPKKALCIDVPLIEECYANLECKVIDMKIAAQYNIFILQVLKAWKTISKKRQRTIHHAGKGNFIIDGKMIKLPSKKK